MNEIIWCLKCSSWVVDSYIPDSWCWMQLKYMMFSFCPTQLYDFASEAILTFGLSRLSLLNFGSYEHILAMIGHVQPFVSSFHPFFLYLNTSMVEPGRKLLSKRTCLNGQTKPYEIWRSIPFLPWKMTIFETKLISAELCFFIFMMGGRVKDTPIPIHPPKFNPLFTWKKWLVSTPGSVYLLYFQDVFQVKPCWISGGGGIPLSKSLKKKKEGLNHLNLSGQFITTSAEVTRNGGLGRESPPKWP